MPRHVAIPIIDMFTAPGDRPNTLCCFLVPLDNTGMSGRTDPWDAMVQDDESDDDYIPTSADGIEDDYRDIDEEDPSDDDELEVLSPCMLSLTCVASAKFTTGCP